LVWRDGGKDRQIGQTSSSVEGNDTDDDFDLGNDRDDDLDDNDLGNDRDELRNDDLDDDNDLGNDRDDILKIGRHLTKLCCFLQSTCVPSYRHRQLALFDKGIVDAPVFESFLFKY